MLQPVLHGWLSRIRLAGAARIRADIDPYNFLGEVEPKRQPFRCRSKNATASFHSSNAGCSR